MVHKRSEEAMIRRRLIREEKRQLRRVLLDSSFRDHQLAETVSRMKVHFEGLIADHGDVLLDARGRGTLQQINFGR